jgi:hypothetical protein
MERKDAFVDSMESGVAVLGVAPEAFDAGDMVGTVSELVFSVFDPPMPGISQIDEPVVAPPMICVDDGFDACLIADNGL